MMKQLCLSADFDSVFFVAKDKALLDSLRKHLNDVRDNDRLVKVWKYRHSFYFAILSELLMLGLKAPFVGDGTTVVLEDIAGRM
jgi:hypothetical protein